MTEVRKGKIVAFGHEVSRSRDRLVFSQFGWDMHLYRFNAGLPAEQVAASSSFETDPHFSPDGRRQAFGSARAGNVAIWVAARSERYDPDP
jgi:Tol biopolymer transport system component